MTDKDDERAALKAELKAEVLAELKAAQPAPPPPYDPVEAERATRAWVDQMHQMREGRANVVPNWLREACRGGVTDADARDLLRLSHAPQGPNSQGAIPSSQHVSNVRGSGVAGGGTGWVEPRPLGPPPGIHHVDAQMIADEVRQRAELKRKLGEK